MAHTVARRRALAAVAATPLAALLPAASGIEQASAAGPGRRSIPRGYGQVDPRTARRVPLWQQLSPKDAIFPGDPAFRYEIFNTIAADGYLLEKITSLGTHTGTHISAPAHFVEGGRFLDEIGEFFAMMPLAVVDVSERVRRHGGDFSLEVADLRHWERRHGRIPAHGCVLLYSGFSKVYFTGAYFDPAPGFTGEATAWLYEHRRIAAIGSDTFGPDASSDEDFSATSTALAAGGITVENVGPGLSRVRERGDWISINGARPHFSGFQMGITGFTR